jgi:Ca-activated chloride channel family protein
MPPPTYALQSAFTCLSVRFPSWKKFALPLVSALVLLSLNPAPSFAQTDEDDVIRVDTNLLLFPIRVKDKKGKAIEALSEADLSLKDPDKVTSGLYFSAGVDRIALVFALDQSGSLREIVAQQQNAALALFSRFSDRSSVAVIRFSDVAQLAAPFDSDPAKARSAFTFPAINNRHTAIFDAAAKAITTFDTLPRVRGERRIVVLISDGLDTVSRSTPASIIKRAIENQVSFYTIHIPLFEPRDGRLVVRTPSKGFRDLAEKTGGKYFLVGDAKSALSPNANQDLSPIFNAIEEDLKSQYVVGFYLAEGTKEGVAHRISIGITRPGVVYSVAQYGYAQSHDFFVNPTVKKKTAPE